MPGMEQRASTYGIQASAGYWIQRLASSMDEHLKTQFTQHGVPKWYWPVLSVIHNGEASTPMQVARFIGLDPAAVTRRLDALEAEGLLTRKPSAQDRRSVTLGLTRKAKRLVEKLATCSRATNDRFLTGVSAADAQALTRIIGAMLRNAEGPVHEL